MYKKIEVGEQYGDLVIQEVIHTGKGTKYKVICSKCNRERILSRRAIMGGLRTLLHKSCIDKEASSDKAFKERWKNMKTRSNQDGHIKQYKVYRDNHIKNEGFPSFIDFVDTMYASYKDHIAKFGTYNTTLERIDNKKGYSPENCCWATRAEQSLNTSIVRTIKATSPDGKEYIVHGVCTFCREHGLTAPSVFRILRGDRKTHHGWTFSYVD